jgi:hypothetical protein
VVSEYCGKVDQLMSERKEQQKEKETQQQQQREQVRHAWEQLGLRVPGVLGSMG